MSDYPHRVQVEAVRWLDASPGLRLFRCLRQSLAPWRMFLALLLVVLLFLGGKAMDFVWGQQVLGREIENYTTYTSQEYDEFLERFAQRMAEGQQFDRQPIFQTLLQHELMHFDRMVSSAVGLNFGLTELLRGQSGGVIGEIESMVVVLPGWLLNTHPWFSAIFLFYAFVLTMILGGAIARLAALDACRGMHGSPFEALQFSLTRARHLIAAPLLPLAVALLIGALLALAGLVCFNLPVLDVIGGLAFGILLALGGIAALFLLALAFGCHLLTPAVAVEDADAFDAVSRSFSYLAAHPWRYILYLAVTVVYGAVGYLVVGLVLFSTIWVTKTAVGLLTFSEAAEGVNRFDAILPTPMLGQVSHEPNLAVLDTSGKVAATLVGVWVKLLVGVLAAYCVSFYFTAMTWVYLLLRYYSDGAAFDEITLDAPAAPAADVPDKVELNASAAVDAD
ncbi:MAG: hypothetical protein IT445_10380 [Phycisphaeraceae bacterium]|nr:hypothetical protein [Phycisphaeraceae bacterium]